MTSALSTTPTTAPLRRPHLTAVPESEPPFDRCDRHPSVPPRRRTALSPLPRQRSVAAAIDDAERSRQADNRPLHTPTNGLPPAAAVARAVARGLIEVLSGIRPVRQLGPVCTPSVQADLGARVCHDGVAPRLISVRTGEPADGVAEVAAVFRRGPRAIAMAFRLQGFDGRWQVTALQIG